MKLFLSFRSWKKQFYFIFFSLTIFCFYFWWQQAFTQEKLPARSSIQEPPVTLVIKEPIQPIPEFISLNPKKVELGNKLFHDTILSANNTISCASCHNLHTAGVDRLPKSIGNKGALTDYNTPTVFNSGFNFTQNWTGKFSTLEEQIDGSIHNPKDMDDQWKNVVKRLKSNPEYKRSFAQIYPDKITAENIKDAIATFERSLYTPNSRFDKFLRGDNNAITAEEKQGYLMFKDYGCSSCHQGINVGGNLFQKFGIIGEPLGKNSQGKKPDLGRFNITGKEEDRYVFKVPSLRNITLTPPYFHNGDTPDLETAVALMAKYQLGRQISGKEIDLIVKFLRTLEGEYQGKPL